MENITAKGRIFIMMAVYMKGDGETVFPTVLGPKRIQTAESMKESGRAGNFMEVEHFLSLMVENSLDYLIMAGDPAGKENEKYAR